MQKQEKTNERINREEVGIIKYFIKDKSIEGAYKIFENHTLAFPKDTNFYEEAYSNKDVEIMKAEERRLLENNLNLKEDEIF